MEMKWKIGSVEMENPFILAPMAGVTDLPFRMLCKEQGAGLLCTEMVSAKAISFHNKNTISLMQIDPSSSPVMWEQICVENHKNISTVLDEYIRMLIQIRCSIDNQEAENLYDMFARSRDYRDSIDATSSGLINKTYVLYIDIVDEAGGIATIATILAMEGISIKNIGIIHNREFEQGVLKIEFYEEGAMQKGSALLKKRNYIVYER